MDILTKNEFEDFTLEIKSEISELKKLISSQKNKKVLKNKDLKEYLGCSYSTLEKMRNLNLIPFKKVMGNYYYDIDKINEIFYN
jgi:hypothetical protein